MAVVLATYYKSEGEVLDKWITVSILNVFLVWLVRLNCNGWPWLSYSRPGKIYQKTMENVF